MTEYLRDLTKPITQTFAKAFVWAHPNVLSLVGIIFFFPGMYFYAVGNAGLGSLFLLGTLFDKVDGDVAELTDRKTKFGGVLDATIDRFTEGLVLMSIGIGGLAPWWLLFLVFNTSICISYIKAKAEAAASQSTVGKNQFSVGIAQRGDRVAILFIGSIVAAFFTDLDILTWTVAILLVLQTITLAWRGTAIYIALRRQ